MRPLAQWSRPLSLLHVRWLLQVARLLLHVLHRLLLLHMYPRFDYIVVTLCLIKGFYLTYNLEVGTPYCAQFSTVLKVPTVPKYIGHSRKLRTVETISV